MIKEKIGLSIHYRNANWLIQNRGIPSMVLLNNESKKTLCVNDEAILQEGMKVIINDEYGKMFYVQFDTVSLSVSEACHKKGPAKF